MLGCDNHNERGMLYSRVEQTTACVPHMAGCLFLIGPQTEDG